MSVRDALNSEFTKFQEAEAAFLESQAQALNNEGSVGFKWYKQGPAAEHAFTRKQLDKAVAETDAAPERIAKNAADMIANCERAFNARYLVRRLDLFVRGRVRMDQLKLAGQTFRDQLDEEVV